MHLLAPVVIEECIPIKTYEVLDETSIGFV